MAAIVKMPKLSDTMEEGAIASWLKKEGDKISEGEPLVEIETDKATMEFVSPNSGTLLKVIVGDGQSAALQAPIAVVGDAGENFDLAKLIDESGGAAADSPSDSKAAPDLLAEPVAPAASPQAAPATPAAGGGRIKASPLAKKMAASKGVELGSLVGSGPNGRIVAADVDNGPVSRPAVFGAARENTVIPLTMMRKTIAKRLLAGKNDAPHFYLTISAQMDETWAWRERLNSDPRVVAGELPKVSFNDILLLVCSRALMKHPEVNSSWQGDSIIQFGAADISMAVALPTGLVTPVIRNCDLLSVRDISAEAKRLGARARAGELQPEEYAGGSFTISNLGMTRIEHFTAIINPPQSCILAVGTITQEPAVSEDGELEVQRRMQMTLSCDHRVVDGMLGAQFLDTVVSYLEDPLAILA